MDPTALATAITALLAPYLAKAGEKAAEKIGEALPDQIGQLWNAVGEKFKDKPAAEEAVKDLVAAPTDEDTQAAFRKELKKLLTNDPAFIGELGNLLHAAQGQHATLVEMSGDYALNVGDNFGTINYTAGSKTESTSTDTTNIGTQLNDSTVGGDVTGHDKITTGQ